MVDASQIIPQSSQISKAINTSEDTAQRLIAHLWRGGNFGYLWTDAGKRSRWQQTSAALPPLTRQQNYYFGVHPTNEKPDNAAHRRSTTATVSAGNCLFAEYDAKDFKTGKRGALIAIEALPLPPSVIIDSGGGYHCYWLLRDTFHITSDAEREFIRTLQARWVDHLPGSDPAAKDLARVLRVPGTTNYKPKYAPNFPTVRTVSADFDRLYTLAELADLLPAPEEKPAIAKPYTRPKSAAAQDRVTRWAVDWFNRRLTDLLTTPKGSRNNRLYALSFLTGQLVGVDLLTRGAAENALTNAGQQLGQSAATVRSGVNGGEGVAPEWIPDFDTHPATAKKRRRKTRIEDTIKPVTLPDFHAHQTATMRYISELPVGDVLQHPTVLIKSPLGTGKTELVKRVIADLDRKGAANVLVVTHRQALAADIAARLGLECYKTIPDNMLHQAHRLVITYNSLHKIGTARQWDLVVIDEIEQFHQHLFGGTFRGGEAYRAHTALVGLLSRAKHFIGLDAHLTDSSASWLHSVTQQAPYLIENTYRHEWGDLTLHAREDSAMAAALTAAQQDRGPVVITTSSIERSRVYEKLVHKTIGTDGVLLVNSENSSSADIQRFIDHINTEITNLRVLICTPSFGTGLDVTAPVYGVFGIMLNRPLIATDMLQMLGRFRNAEQRHVYVQPLHQGNPVDWLARWGEALDADFETRRVADFAQHHIAPVDAGQHTILRLFAQLNAAADLQQADLISYFAAAATVEGFTLTYQNGQHTPTRQAIHAAREAIADERKVRVVAARAVTRQEYELHLQNGTITPDIIAGYKRWKIENTAGLTITGELYDDLHTSAQRASLRRLADLLTDVTDLQARDRLEARENVLLVQRGHYTTTRDLIFGGVSAVFGDSFLTASAELTEADIVDRLTPWLTDHLPQVRRMVGSRQGLSDDPMFVLRRLLKAIGLKLARRQVMVNSERYMVYWLDQETRARWVGYARARLAHLASIARITTNREKDLSVTERSNAPPNATDPPPLDMECLKICRDIVSGKRAA